MSSSSPAVVLIHGFTGSPVVWDDVVPHLAAKFDVHAPALVGHLGASPWPLEGGDLSTLVDGVEAYLDARSLERPHLVGNSLGAWVGLELASRGRAGSVLAIAPAGFWGSLGAPEYERLIAIFARADRDAARSRRLLPLLFAFPPLRRFAFRGIARYGNRLTREQALRLTEGVLACSAYPALTEPIRAGARRYEGLGCPVKVVLTDHDKVFPLDPYRPAVAEHVPEAEIEVLEGVGHTPMIDDPRRIAGLIAGFVENSPEVMA